MRTTKFSILGGALALLICPSFAAPTNGAGANAKLFKALRDGDTPTVRTLARGTSAINAPNMSGETPLMYAAIYSNAEIVKFLLDQGAEVNAKTPTGTTALMLAVGDIEKVRVLIKRGANVNARSVTGRTPLLIAASRSGAGEVVKLLLAHGADANAKDELQGIPLIPAGAGGSTALIEAAKIRDGKALEYLIEAGANVQTKDNSGADALVAAVVNGNTGNVQRLLAHGARVDTRATPNQFTSLILATWRQDPKLTKMLIDAGADPNAQDAHGATALMWSSYSDYADPATTQVLLNAGAKVDAHNQTGETAMTWARKRGDTAMVRLLLASGAKDEPAPARLVHNAMVEPLPSAQSAAKGIALLQQTGPTFFKVSGCVSCHNQSLPQMVTGAARSHGIPVDEALAKTTMTQVSSILKPAKLPLMEMSDVVPDLPITGPYILLGMAAEGYQPDEFTDATVLNLAAKQYPDGSWRPWSPRPPIEYSPITATALAIRAFRVFAPPARRAEFDQRIAAGREWLRNTTPRTNEEKAMRLIGLEAANASRSEIAAAAKTLLNAQRADGGWSQLDTLESDAYATGQALYALRTAGGVTATHPAYVRGADYLRETQEQDGSWHVASRSFPFQPYNESGFPHGNDQWISASGTGWAALALMLDQEPATAARR